MNAIAFELPETPRRWCWPCTAIWLAAPMFWVALFALALLKST